MKNSLRSIAFMIYLSVFCLTCGGEEEPTSPSPTSNEPVIVSVRMSSTFSDDWALSFDVTLSGASTIDSVWSNRSGQFFSRTMDDRHARGLIAGYLGGESPLFRMRLSPGADPGDVAVTVRQAASRSGSIRNNLLGYSFSVSR